MSVRHIGIAWFALYAGTILAANWSIQHFGAVPVGFGLMAPAGVYFAGLAFTFRDGVHERYGARGALVAIAVGTALSVWINPAFALASGVAFGLSELADLVVYTPLREHRRLLAIVLSNTVGLIVDSALFLWLAFGSFAYLPGQIVGKAWMTLLAVVLVMAWRRYRCMFGFHSEQDASSFCNYVYECERCGRQRQYNPYVEAG